MIDKRLFGIVTVLNIFPWTSHACLKRQCGSEKIEALIALASAGRKRLNALGPSIVGLRLYIVPH